MVRVKAGITICPHQEHIIACEIRNAEETGRALGVTCAEAKDVVFIMPADLTDEQRTEWLKGRPAI